MANPSNVLPGQSCWWVINNETLSQHWRYFIVFAELSSQVKSWMDQTRTRSSEDLTGLDLEPRWWTLEDEGQRWEQEATVLHKLNVKCICRICSVSGLWAWTPSDCSWIMYTSFHEQWLVSTFISCSFQVCLLSVSPMLDLWAHVVSQILPGFKLCASDWGVTTGQ